MVVNKWDLFPKELRKKAIKYMEKQLATKFSLLKDIKLFCVSAKTGLNLNKVLDEVLMVYKKWNLRVTTGMLNDWLRRFKKIHPAPTHNRETLKIRYFV